MTDYQREAEKMLCECLDINKHRVNVNAVAGLLEDIDKSNNAQNYFDLAKSLTETMLKLSSAQERIKVLEGELQGASKEIYDLQKELREVPNDPLKG